MNMKCVRREEDKRHEGMVNERSVNRGWVEKRERIG